MYKRHKIGIVVPAYNESRLISNTINGIPKYVDRIVAVDDASLDDTYKKLQGLSNDDRLITIRHKKNRGVGGSIIDGYLRLLEEDVDITVVMAGDNQMDPQYLPVLLDKLTEGDFDVAKGNRFLHSYELGRMPPTRMWGNVIVTLLTKISSGYWSIFDTTNGYVASKTQILKLVDFKKIKRGFDFEISMLINLNILGAKIADVPIPAVYGKETSKLKAWKVFPGLSWTFFSGFWKRVFYKYIFYNTHPLALFLIFGLLLLIAGLVIGIWAIVVTGGHPTASTALLAALPLILGFQLLLTAVVIDIQNEPK
ncbi:MAG TPA: glycosyltransferase family 2 protein [Candidatus Nanoarchaeia archaeon]